VRGEQRQDAQLGTGQGRCPGDGGGVVRRQLSPQGLRLADQGAEVGPTLEQLTDFPHQRSGSGYVGQREVDAGELDPGLHCLMRHRVGDQGPQALSGDQVLAHRGYISPVQG
jgi:hypothetical protein